MKEITQYIDDHYLAIYPAYKFWGLAELTDKSEDRHPVTVNGREKVGLLDSFDCCVWYREISANQTEYEENGYGLTPLTQFSVTLRIIVAYKIALGEEFKFEFANNFPKLFDIEGYSFLSTKVGKLDLDHERIAEEEEIHTQYEQHRICWNIFSFDNDIEFVICEPSSP